MGHRSHLSSFAGQCTAAKRANERKRFATIGISPDLDWAQRVESVRPTESYLRGSICDPVNRISSVGDNVSEDNARKPRRSYSEAVTGL